MSDLVDRPSQFYLNTLTKNTQRYIAGLEVEIERLRAEQITIRATAWSDAGDFLANNWNLVQPRGESWCAMTDHVQRIWKDMKGISDDYHKAAAEAAGGDDE